MSAETEDDVDPADNPLFAELLSVHSALRRELETVTALARETAAGLAPAEVRERVEGLRADSALWRLKYGCLHYCSFVHRHHRAEDAILFPVLRRDHPELDSVVDRLEREHREISTVLTEVETAAEELDQADEADRRARLVAGLERLGGLLLAHLEFEEGELEQPLKQLRGLLG